MVYIAIYRDLADPGQCLSILFPTVKFYDYDAKKAFQSIKNKRFLINYYNPVFPI